MVYEDYIPAIELEEPIEPTPRPRRDNVVEFPKITSPELRLPKLPGKLLQFPHAVAS
jgi:hypothetical protein